MFQTETCFPPSFLQNQGGRKLFLGWLQRQSHLSMYFNFYILCEWRKSLGLCRFLLSFPHVPIKWTNSTKNGCPFNPSESGVMSVCRLHVFSLREGLETIISPESYYLTVASEKEGNPGYAQPPWSQKIWNLSVSNELSYYPSNHQDVWNVFSNYWISLSLSLSKDNSRKEKAVEVLRS